MSNVSDYIMRSLSELATVEYGKSPNIVRDDNGTYPVYGTGGQVGYANSYLFEGDSVIVARKGSLNKPAYVTDKYWVIDTAYSTQPKENIDAKWLYYSLSNFNLESLNEATGVPSISRDFLYKTKFYCPDYHVQKKIAKILTTIDQLIEKTQALIDKHAAIKQGMMRDLFTRGIDLTTGQLRLPVEQAPHLYKETELGWIPNEWKGVTLEDVTSVERGKFTHRPRDDEKCYGGIYPFIQTGNVTKANGGYISQYKQTLSEYGRSVSREFPVDTIAVTIAANIADTAILKTPMCFPDSVVGVIVNKSLAITRFIELTIRLNKHRLDALAPLSAQKNINLEDLRPLKIQLPSYREQVEICKRYESIDSNINIENKKFNKLQLIKNGLMQDLLTGKVKVN